MVKHLLQAEFLGVGDMRAFYAKANMLPTSETADVALIRSHIAYWMGAAVAERAAVKASRGSTYRVALNGRHGADDAKVRISDHFDHREGVMGLVGYFAQEWVTA